jgi:hypothetical protein
MKRLRAWRTFTLGALALISLSTAAAAQKVSDGTYILEGGSYSIEVVQDGDNLVVVEPNKRSPYTRQADGSFHFYNPNTDTVYGIRVIDNQTIEAFKPFQGGNVPTRLVRLGGTPSQEAPSQESASEPETAGNDAGAIADRYQKLAQTDPDHVQAWTACAAAAKKRELATNEEADAYAAQMAEVLKLILVDPSRSPCEDAIPASTWSPRSTDASPIDEAASAVAEAARAEEEAAKRRQQEADARWQKLEAETQQRIAEQRAAQQAYETGVREAAEARQRFEEEMARHRDEVARAEAQKAEYQRQMEEYRRQTGGGSSQ